MTLGWNMSVGQMQGLKKYIGSLRLEFTVNNLASIFGYSGPSSMINSSTVNATLGLDDKLGYPLARIYTTWKYLYKVVMLCNKSLEKIE